MKEYLGLEDGPPIFKQDFTCPALLLDSLCLHPYRTITSLVDLPRSFRFNTTNLWPRPISLATTLGVSIDVLSYGYLDVSVHRVRLLTLCIQIKILHMQWVAPFGYPRIFGPSHLPMAFRSVARPSSPLHA
jgi:hypothetical protein